MIHFMSFLAVYPCRTCASMLLPESPIGQSVQPVSEGSLNDTVMVQQQHCTLGAKAPPFVFSISFLVFDVLVSIVLLLVFHPVVFGLFCLLPPLDRLHGHLHQPILGLAVGEIADALDGFLGVVLCQRSCLVDAVCFEDELSRLLQMSVTLYMRTAFAAPNGQQRSTHPQDIALSSKLPPY